MNDPLIQTNRIGPLATKEGLGSQLVSICSDEIKIYIAVCREVGLKKECRRQLPKALWVVFRLRFIDLRISGKSKNITVKKRHNEFFFVHYVGMADFQF